MDWRSAADTAGKGRDGSLSRVVSGRMAALAFVLASLLVMASELVVPGTYSRIAVVVIGTAALVVGAASWWIPWERLPRTTVLWLVPVGLAAIGVGFAAAAAVEQRQFAAKALQHNLRRLALLALFVRPATRLHPAFDEHHRTLC